MAFLKSKWRLLTFIGVCLLSAGGGAWAYMAGDAVMENMKALDEKRKAVDAAKNTRVNTKVIEEIKRSVEKSNADFDKSMNSALAVQKNDSFAAVPDAEGKIEAKPRKLLLEKSLPKPTKAVAINFKEAYARAFDAMKQRLHGRDKPTSDEVSRWSRVLAAPKSSGSIDLGPWGPPDEGDSKSRQKERTLAQILREYPRARAADEVARGIYMYVNDQALVKHAKLLSMDVPTEIEIWQAQMSLWIQQDFVALLARMNEERVEKLKAENRADDCWVAYLPVKHLLIMRIDNKLGKGGGSNPPRGEWPPSFTGLNNDDRMFKVPLQIEVVIEEAVLMDLLERICRMGFYTPIRVNYDAVKPNPLQEDYIYGEEPVVKVILDIEAFYFRPVFEEWIPEKLKKILKTPNAVDDGK